LPGNVFEVVDGQQRLTTIFILLTYLKDIATMLGKPRFRLTFATVRTLTNLSLNKSTSAEPRRMSISFTSAKLTGQLRVGSRKGIRCTSSSCYNTYSTTMNRGAT
jgi:hypothetical protein